VRPLEIPAQASVTVRAATFGPGGIALTAPRTQVVDASTLLSRDGSELASCSEEPGMRVYADRPAQGPRPVYQINAGDMCWGWHRAPVKGIRHVTLSVARVAWRFGDEAKGAVVRAKASAAGEFEIHAGSCQGPLLARLPLAPAAQGKTHDELRATVATPPADDAADLCIFATGDPRDGQWALARVAFSN
jgi:hexosaminidase